MARWSNVRAVSDCGTVVAVDVGELALEVRRVQRDGLWWVGSQEADEVIRACDHLSSDEIGRLLWDVEHAD